MNRKEATSLLVSGLAITGGVVSAYLTGGITLINPEILAEGLKSFGGLGGNLFANAIQSKLIDKHPQEDVLKNGDLTRAIGSAIFKLCGELAEVTKNSSDKNALVKLSQTPLAVWENLIIGGEYEEGYGLSLSTINLDEVSAEKSVQYVHAQADKLDEIKTLTPQSWQNIIVTLYKKENYSLSATVKAELADKLHKEFARALRKVLIADFATDGKAYASMQFRILGEILNYLNEILAYSKQNYELSDSILAIIIDLSKEVAKINQQSPTHYSPANKIEWQQISTDFNSFRVTLDLTFQNTETIIAIVTKILENQEKTSVTKIKIPQGLINIQREKNDYFVEQGNIFARMDGHLEVHHSGYLHGTHGLGKTTTLCEYAYSRVGSYDFVFYVLATDGAIENELARFADDFIEGVAADFTPAQKASMVRSFLEDAARWTKESRNWLIIFDNLESREQIEKYFPNPAKGDCLYSCNEKLFIGNDREIDFEQFSQTEAELFVFQRLTKNPTAKHEEITVASLAEHQKLIDQLGRLPLSLNIATAFLLETDVSIDEYIELLKANAQKFLEYKDLHGQHQSKTVFAAFSVTLDRLSTVQTNDTDDAIIAKLAETFLNLLIFVAPEDIPEEIISNTLFKTVDTSATTTPTNILFRQTVALLKRFGLIKEKTKPFKYKEKFDEPKTLPNGTTAHWEEKETAIKVFNTYRTLQDILSARLEPEPKKLLFEQYLIDFNDLLPDPEVTTWEIYGKYAIHAFPIAEQIVTLAISNDKSWRICNQIGFYFDNIAQYREAEYFYLLAKEITEHIYGQEHENTATSYNNLAGLYYSQEKYELAEPLYKQALKIREIVLGENHPHTAGSYNNLALLYYSQGKYELAEPLYKLTLKIYEKVLGENHPETAQSYNNLAALYFSKGNLELAREYQQKSLKVRLANFGENHPDIAQSYWWLGVFCGKETNYREALDHFYHAREIYLRFFTEEHPEVKNLQTWIDGCEELVKEK